MKLSVQKFLNAFKAFWSNVRPGHPAECWNWAGHRNTDGYGHIGVMGYIVRSHRFSWIIHHGPIPNKLCVCHKCDNPSCVNPTHLFLGTVQDNVHDRQRKGRSRGGSQPGISHNMAKLNDDLVVRIFNEAKNKTMPQKRIGVKYGVSQSVVSRILNGDLWKHLNLLGSES